MRLTVEATNNTRSAIIASNNDVSEIAMCEKDMAVEDNLKISMKITWINVISETLNLFRDHKSSLRPGLDAILYALAMNLFPERKKASR